MPSCTLHQKTRPGKHACPSLYARSTKWDALIGEGEDEDEDMQFIGGPSVPRDMRYNMFNIHRQRDNFEAIKAVAGKELIHDVYARDPDVDTFWFVGKVARTSDVTADRAVARQWHLIEEHACRLRPNELYPQFGKLQLWVAPGDSEMDVAYRKADLAFSSMDRDAEGAGDVRNVEVGFAGELYENNEDGFRTQRTDEGRAIGPDISGAGRQPTGAELDEMMEELNAQAEKMEAGDVPPVE